MDVCNIICKFSDYMCQVLQLTAVIWNVLLSVVLVRLKTSMKSYFSLVKRKTIQVSLQKASPFGQEGRTAELVSIVRGSGKFT